MDLPRSMIVFAWIIAAFTVVLVVAAIIVARAGGPRRMAVVLLVASALPFACGVVGGIGGYFVSMREIETLKAPTPKDLAAGVRDSELYVALGAIGSAASGVAALVAFLRSARKDEPPPLR